MKRIPEEELMLDEEQARAYAEAIFHIPHERFVKLFGERFQGDLIGKYVLDLGCGTGLIAEHLRPLARRLTGIDLSPEMVDRARQSEFYDLLEVAEITDWLSWDSKPTFDLIVACDTLIYFGDLSQVVVPAANRLGPNGILAFTVEKGRHNEPFRLTDSGRYTDTINHITSVAEDVRLGLDRICTEALRHEYGEPVEGLLVVLSRS